MFSVARRDIAAISIAVLGSLSFLFWLLAKGSQLESTSFVDPKIQITESLPIALSSESSDRYSFDILIRSQKIPQSLEILMGTFDDPSVLIRSGQAISANGKCRYETKKDTLLLNNNHLRFDIAECDSNPDLLSITIETRRPVKLGLWTYSILPPNSAPSGVLLKSLNSISGESFPYLYGFFQYYTHNPELKKYELLHFMWDLKIEAQYFLAMLICALLGANFFIGRSLLRNSTPLSAGLAWLFFSFTYAMLVPPFQAPDEPDHALTYAGLSSDESLDEKMLELAQRGHFEYLKFYAHHKFTSTRLLAPNPTGWASHVAPVEMKTRSPATYLIWPVFSKFLDGSSASAVVLALRLLNSLITAFGIFLALTFLRPHRRLRLILVFLLFAMPALPFFAMHISNYFTSVFVAFLHCGIFVALLSGDRFTGLRCFVCGCVMSFSLASSAIATGFLACWVFMMPWVFFAYSQERPQRKHLHLKAFAFLMPGLVIGHLIFFPQFRLPSIGRDADYKYWLMILWGENKAIVAGAAMIFWGLGVGCLSYFLPVVCLGKLAMSKRSLDKLGRLFSLGILVVLLALNLVAVFHKFTPLPNIEDPQSYLAPFPYALSSLKAGLLALTFTHMDKLLSASFWMGFGWLESYPPDGLILMIRSPLVIGCFLYFWRLWARPAREDRSFDWRGFMFAISLFVMLAGLSVVTSAMSVNLHGRYLIGFYMLTAVVSAIGWAYFFETKLAWKLKVSLRMASTLLVVGSHGYSAWFLLDRYF